MSTHDDASRTFDRRAFLQLSAAALAAQALGPARAGAQTATPPAPPAPAAPAPAALAPSAEALALTELLRRRFPDRFTDAQWASITRDFDFDLGAGRRMRAVALANGDEPDFAFRV